MYRIVIKVFIFLFSIIGAAVQNIPTFSYYFKKKVLNHTDSIKINKRINSSRVAIISIYKIDNLELIINQCLELKNAGYDIIAVFNSKIPQGFIKQSEDYFSVTIERPNIARDFGAYKAGYLYLFHNDLLSTTDELLFINDTILFPLFDSDSFWKRLRSNPSDIVAPFESFSPRYHLQSFFMLCKNGIHKKESFANFWLNYTEWNSRKHAINSGEVGFSQLMRKQGFKLSALVDTKSLTQIPTKKLIENTFIFNIDKNVLIECFGQDSKNEIILSEMQRQLAVFYESGNPSHTLAIVAVMLLDIPMLKRDLVYRGSVTLTELVSINEKLHMMTDSSVFERSFKERGLPVSQSLFEKFLMAINYK